MSTQSYVRDPHELEQEALEDFLNDPQAQKQLAQVLDWFSMLCGAQARKSGFDDDPQAIRGILQTHGTPVLQKWFDDCEIQAELARIGSEVGEAVEAVRKDLQDTHLPAMHGFPVEVGDVLIRCGDTAARHDFSLGKHTVAKMVFNATRTKKHGKGS